jgi:hypothetical protein
MIYFIIFFITIIIIYINISFYRNSDYHLDIHTFKKIDMNDLKTLYKLRQPIVFKYNLNTINTENLDTIFNNKNVSLINNKSGKITNVKWKNNKKNNCYMVARFKSNRNKEFKPLMNYESYENYIILNDKMSTLPKYSNIYSELITPINGECTIRILKNEERHYLNEKSGKENEVYFLNNIFTETYDFKDIHLKKGDCIIIPSKWIYSIKTTTPVILFNQSWETYINKLAHIDNFIKHNL